MSFANPKGIASFSPRLARQRLPRVNVWNRKQRQRRCGPQPNVAATPLRWVTNQTNRTTSTRLWLFVREWESPQPRCGWDVCWTMTQGSAFRPTLGFGSESRWDSPNAQFKNRSSQSSGTQHQPQRGCGSKPKVGAHAPTLGERGKAEATAMRLWPTSRVMDGANGRNRVAVENVCWTMTQGSALRATLGFGTESRWDSPNAQFKNPSSQS